MEVHGEAGLDGLRRSAQRTREAMRDGAEIIYQAVLFDGVRRRGYADFLERVPKRSALGEWSYEVADTKLGRRVKPYFLLQLCFYSELLAAEQGTVRERIHVVLGTHARESFRLRCAARPLCRPTSDRPGARATSCSSPRSSGASRACRIFCRPTPLARAVDFVDGLVAQPTCLATDPRPSGSSEISCFRAASR